MVRRNATLLGLLLYFLATCCACFRGSQGPTLSRIGARNQSFVDQVGRIRIFHGFNAVVKNPPWYPDYLLNQTRLKLYKSWGFTAVRLGTMWSGVMPQKEVINQTYLEILGNIVSQLEKNGLYAILDMHQDVLSSKFGTYDGAPRWLIDELPPARHPFPWPLKKATFWSDGYLADATGRAFQAIYHNVASARDYFIQFWKTVANFFKDKTSVLGYELINEPWAGDIYSNPSLLLPGEAGSKNLMPTYDLVNAAIRGIDNETIVFYEPVTWGMVFEGRRAGSGFQKVPGGDAYRTKSALSYHYYCWVLGTGQRQTVSSVKRDVCDKVLGPIVFESVKQDLQVTGGASFLTEFGMCDSGGSPNSTTTIECQSVMAQADQHLQSWTYWDSDFFDASGNVNWDIVRVFARPYAQAVAGVLIQNNFNPQTKEFKLSFVYSAATEAPTEIVVPLIQYPKGFHVFLTKGFHWTYDEENFIVSLLPDSKDLILKTVTVSITSK